MYLHKKYYLDKHSNKIEEDAVQHVELKEIVSMREEKTIYYDKNDMLALKEMSNEEAAEWLDRLDRGYFNMGHYPDNDPDYKEYSEWEYREYAMQVALAKADKILRNSK